MLKSSIIFFCDAFKDLDIDRSKHVNRKVNVDDPIQKYIEMYKNHPSILKIHEEEILQDRFSFLPISETRIHSLISNIDSSKAYQSNNIPPKVLNDNADIYSNTFRQKSHRFHSIFTTFSLNSIDGNEATKIALTR